MHSVWRRGSSAQFDSATRFSSPGDLPSSTRSRDVGGSPERPCLVQGDCFPPGKGRYRAGPSSREEAGVLQPLLHRTQETWWPSTNPGSASFEPGFTQAPVQDADAQAHYQMHPAPELVCPRLGLRVNWEKSKLSPVQIISFLGVELDSVSMTARLMEKRAQAVLNCLSSFRGRNVVPLKQFQRLLGHMTSAAAVTLLGLLHMRPLQHWLHSRVPRWAWRRGTLRVVITQQCRRSLSPWTDFAFLRAAVPLEQVSRHTVVTVWSRTSTGWEVYDHTACHSSPTISSSGVTRSSVSLLPQTLCKLREDEEKVLLVAPHRPTRTWFPELISLATAPPWRIPLRKDLLTQGLGAIWHPRPDLWNLHVWLLDVTRQT